MQEKIPVQAGRMARKKVNANTADSYIGVINLNNISFELL